MKQLFIEYLEFGIWGAFDKGGEGDVVEDTTSLPSDTLLAFFKNLVERYPEGEFEILYGDAAILCELIDYPVAILNGDPRHQRGLDLFLNRDE